MSIKLTTAHILSYNTTTVNLFYGHACTKAKQVLYTLTHYNIVVNANNQKQPNVHNTLINYGTSI